MIDNTICQSIPMSSNVSVSNFSAMSKDAFIPKLICDDFPVQIRSLTGKETQIKVHHKMTVFELKNTIEKIDQTPFDQQRLVYNGKQLEDDRTLDYYGLKQDTVIHIILRIRGGMFHETSARKDFGLIQCAWITQSTIESIEELEEKICLLKMKL